MAIKREFLPKWIVTRENGNIAATVTLEKDGKITIVSNLFGSLDPKEAEELAEVLQMAARASRETTPPNESQRRDAF